jgi:K+-sensing histidine kinase KdpD
MKKNVKVNVKSSAKSNFVDMVNHELKSPLATIKISVEIMERHYASALESQMIESLKTIDSKVDILTQLINNYTDLVKIQSDFMSFEDELINFKKLVSDFSQKYSHITLDKLPNSNYKISIDTLMFNRVVSGLINLIPKLSSEDSTSFLAVKEEMKEYKFYLYGLKNRQTILPLPDNTWQKRENDRINTAFAKEFFNHYNCSFSTYYHPNQGIIFSFDLKKVK